LLLLLGVLPGTAHEAHAQPADRKASELKRQGDEAIEALRYVDALSAYSAAYAISNDPALLYNMGRAHEALGHYPEALDQLEAFEGRATADLRARVPNLSARIADLKKRIGKLMVRANVAGARVLVERKVIGVLPFAAPVRINAGAFVLEVTAEGYEPFSREVTLEGGGEAVVDVHLTSKARPAAVAATTAPATGAHEPTLLSRWWFWAGASLVLVGGGAAIYALTTEREADTGTYPPGRVAGPLVIGRALSF
jgi:hypothetical protein